MSLVRLRLGDCVDVMGAVVRGLPIGSGLFNGFLVRDHLGPITRAMPSISPFHSHSVGDGLPPDPVVLCLLGAERVAIQQLDQGLTPCLGPNDPHEARVTPTRPTPFRRGMSDACFLHDLMGDGCIIIPKFQAEGASVAFPLVDAEATLTSDEPREPMSEVVIPMNSLSTWAGV